MTTCVVNTSVHVVVPWTIHQVDDDRLSIMEFYKHLVQEREDLDENVLQEARVGRSKDSLYAVIDFGKSCF